MAKTCLRCNAEFYSDVCDICNDASERSVEKIENYRGYPILKYSDEDGLRVDFGTIRSKLVGELDDARKLIDFRFS